MDNLELWNKVSDTDPKYTKAVKLGGYHFTDIDAMYSIRRATELWGPYGSTWGLKELHIERIYSGEYTTGGLWIQAVFHYPGGQFDIAADMPYEPKGETLKKLQTMCIGKALSRLGFSADVYMGMFDDSAYVAEQNKKYASSGDDHNVRESIVAGNSSDSTNIVPVVEKTGRSKVKKYPEPDPAASGILGALAQKYIEHIGNTPDLARHVVNFKKLCNAVYDKWSQYPTSIDSIPKMMEGLDYTLFVEKNDFIEGLT